MSRTPQKFDICIIGAGSAGLTMAAVSSNLGFKVALVEGHKMGGECLNNGCVPSKALLSVSKQAGSANLHNAQKAIHKAIETIQPHDSQERFESLGTTVIRETASFIDSKTIQAGDKTITAKRFVVATGSRPFIPPIKGLEQTPYLTNETIFEQTELPRKLIIIGGGAVGIEMAYAFCKLGSDVTLIEHNKHILKMSDIETAQFTKETLQSIGVKVCEGVDIKSVQKGQGQEPSVSVETDQETLQGSHLLIATGRQANVENLNLEKAGIETQGRSIAVNKYLRTHNKRIYAIGDCASKHCFTHNASYEAGVIIKRMLFGLFWSKASYKALPKVLYIDPEIAEVGLTTEMAIKRYGAKSIRTIRIPFTENDRAVCDGNNKGFIKAVLNNKGYVLGVTIAGHGAGELITPWTTLMTHNRKVSDLSAVTTPYPTYSEINKKVASEFYKDAFYGTKVKGISKLLFRLLG